MSVASLGRDFSDWFGPPSRQTRARQDFSGLLAEGSPAETPTTPAPSGLPGGSDRPVVDRLRGGPLAVEAHDRLRGRR